MTNSLVCCPSYINVYLETLFPSLVGVCIYVYIHPSMCVYVLCVRVHVVFFSPLYILRQKSHRTQNSLFQVDWLAHISWDLPKTTSYVDISFHHTWLLNSCSGHKLKLPQLHSKNFTGWPISSVHRVTQSLSKRHLFSNRDFFFFSWGK